MNIVFFQENALLSQWFKTVNSTEALKGVNIFRQWLIKSHQVTYGYRMRIYFLSGDELSAISILTHANHLS